MIEDCNEDNGNGNPGRTRVVLFGMRCAFTHPVLSALAERPEVDLVAVVLPRSADPDVATSDPVMDTARAAGIPVIEVVDRPGLRTPAFRAEFERIAPDAIVAACFPWRFPRWLLALPPGGCLNLHPSLLPDGRGPEPVFWAFRWGLRETGVTLHVMDEGLDTGPIVAQRRYAIPDDATIPGVERALAGIGAAMVMEHLSLSRDEPVDARPQGDGTARHSPIPGDLLVRTSWNADDAARFIRAAVPVYGAIPVLVLATGQRLMVEAVIEIHEVDRDPEPVVVQGETVRIRFADGAVTCRLAHRWQPLRLHRIDV